MVNEREIALDILMEVNENEKYLHMVLGEALRKYQYLEKNQRAFISRLARGSVEYRITLDYIIDKVSSVPVAKMKPLIRNLMRLSAYQLKFMENVPASAVCNEAVKLAKKRHFGNLSGFVNGVLRNVARQNDNIIIPEDYSIRYSMPEPVVNVLEGAYGRTALNAMLKCFLEERPVTIITNTEKCSPEKLRERLCKDGVNVMEAPYVAGAFAISDYNFLENMPSYGEGLFQIQDISSMIAGLVAAPKQGDTIIDVCAAPGGKSIFAAMQLKGTGQVIARDVSERKTDIIKANIERLGIKNVTVQTADATIMCREDTESADIVIADVPCSGLGVIGRKPDIKYSFSTEKAERIRELQRKILDTTCGMVKKDGFLIYSTCTLNPYENEENVRYIIDKGFVAENIMPLLPEGILRDSKKAGDAFLKKVTKDAECGYITLIPGIYECDGFFAARLRKKA